MDKNSKPEVKIKESPKTNNDRNITAKNLINKYNNSMYELVEEDEEYQIYVDIHTAS